MHKGFSHGQVMMDHLEMAWTGDLHGQEVAASSVRDFDFAALLIQLERAATRGKAIFSTSAAIRV